MKTIYLITLFLFITHTNVQKEYIRNYDNEGHLVSEGWTKNEKKTDFWTFYYPDGTIEKKGHFYKGKKNGYWYFYTENNNLIKEGTYIANEANNWWIFYEDNRTVKIQFKNGLKDGYALFYQNRQLKKAERYNADKKTGEWTSYIKFRRDNPDLEF
ncbi:MAG: toxin-antitoxin system YwqK family antitoxin [Winogradskyella sp.]|jgi:antitoxin component YwqK of YwqJK toxin-antitoxin module